MNAQPGTDITHSTAFGTHAENIPLSVCAVDADSTT